MRLCLIDAWLVRLLRERGHRVSLLSNSDQYTIFIDVLKRVQRGQGLNAPCDEALST